MYVTIKARGDMELEVLGIPYGSRNNKDSDGEYFDRRTKLHEDKYGLPPVVYYHGYTPDGKPAGKPEYIGKTVGFEDRADGRWYRVILDKSSTLAKRVWQSAKEGLARASSGSISHLVRRGKDGRLKEWPVAELSVFDSGDGRQPSASSAVAVPVLKAVYERAGLDLPEYIADHLRANQEVDGEGFSDQAATEVSEGVELIEAHSSTKGRRMNECRVCGRNSEHEICDECLKKLNNPPNVQQVVADALKADREAQQAIQEADEQRKQEMAEAVEVAVKAEKEKLQEEFKKSNRLAYREDMPTVGKFGDLRKYDHLNAENICTAIEVMKSVGVRPSESAYQAAAVKLEGDKSNVGAIGRSSMKMAGIPYEGEAVKADEINYSTLASYGDEWVGVSYSTSIWNSVRHETRIASMLPQVEVPQGAESIVIPLESTDPVFNVVAQAASDAATGGLSRPAPTVKSSRLGTANNTLTVNKLGARVRWTGELQEDSVINFAPQLNAQLSMAAAEYFESCLIDGDTETATTTNINDIAGLPLATDWFMMFNGFRKLALITNTANSRPGGALDADDYLETMKLMGAAGKNGADPTKCGFIIDPNVRWKSLSGINEIKTKDVWGASTPTIEGGDIVQIWGYKVNTSYSMHYATRASTGYEYKANTAGLLDLDTASNNTTGSILAVRWDQFVMGNKRRITTESVRHPEWDGWEITTLMRAGLLNRDTEAAAITYNITV